MLKASNFLLVIFCGLSLLTSCSTKETPSPELYYTEAMKQLKSKNYQSAAEKFEKIDDEFPFSPWAVKGKIVATYARYKSDDYEKLLNLVNDFIRLNPNSEYVPYMMYMKGLSYYNQIPDIHRAQDKTQEASNVFRELAARFPEDFHAEDALKKLAFVDEHLAGANMSVGRQMMINENYIGAITNFDRVIKFYRHTNQVPESYYRLVEIYCKIGLDSEAKKAFAELSERFPENFWTKEAVKIMDNV
jgi:outer membrane protein assembly factor BamD